jgi:hypothetical protein
MNNEELNRILKSARVPEQPENYWDKFARRVASAVQDRPRTAANSAALLEDRRNWASILRPKFALSVGLSLACAIVVLVLLVPKPRSSSDPQLAAAQKFYRELETLFPNQLRVIAFDDQGPHLTLADSPEVPASPPLYIKICSPEGCRRFVTFSGQQVSINGQACEILLNREGHVLVVGSQFLWPGTAPSGKSGRYDIETRILARAS